MAGENTGRKGTGTTVTVNYDYAKIKADKAAAKARADKIKAEKAAAAKANTTAQGDPFAFNPNDYLNAFRYMVDSNDTSSPVNKVPAYEIFKMQFKKYFSNIDVEAPWINELYNSSKKYYEMGGINPSDIPDLLLSDANAPALYKARFAGIQKLKERQASGVPVSYIPSVAEYTQMSESMKKTFQRYGLNSMGNQDNIASIIGNDVDAEEMQSRMDNAFFAIDNADEYLKKELSTYYPNLSRQDMALALLQGPEGSAELKKKVQTSNIVARASEFGIASAVDAGDLYNRGYTAEETRSGFAKSAAEQKGLQNAATMFGDVGANLFAEQQQGNITDVQTQRVEGLRSKARSEFQKQSGITASSLRRTRSGQI